MTPTANLASAKAEADPPAAPAAEGDSFVLNLCSSTTPMALAQTELPELKRFTFFVSRRFEEGRERFRLHMGFFASLAEAEEWLALVREIYPGAWAGEAPGKKLRARATEAAAAQARHAVGPQNTAAPAAAPKSPPPVARLVSAQSTPAAQVPMLVPTLHPPAAAPAGAPAVKAAAAPVAAVQAARAASPMVARRAPTSAPARRAAPAALERATTLHPAAPPAASVPSSPQGRIASSSAAAQRPAARPAAARPAAPKGAIAPAAHANPVGAPAPKPVQPSASRAAQAPAKKPLFADSNVKEVLAALGSSEDDAGDTRLMPAPSSLVDGNDDSSLTDTQVLRYLETRRAPDDARSQAAPQVDAAAESGISLLKPDDTGTRRALKEAVSQDEAVSFAVQLQWSVQPVALDKVPPLAIFSAYTLYSVEGSREGRKWYGLRLGFFNDAISAKQVAYYVRSEFTSVAVVPVSPEERERATEDNQRLSGVGASRSRGHAGPRRRSEDNEFKLIDLDEAPRATQRPAAAAAVSQAAQPAAARAVRKSGGAPKVQPGLVGARERRTPQTLEETLEILGANELAIDNGGDGSLSDTGVRHLRVEVQKNTPFSRLLERLSERVKKA